MIDQPPSPSSILTFPDTHLDFHSNITSTIALAMGLLPAVLDSITQICGQPRVFGFNDCHFVRRILTPDGSLMDSGANICITNSLAILIDAINITPFTFSIGRDGATHSVDICCTKRGLLPLAMMDGSLYYKPCYYCKNATETIISPQAVVNASDTFISWHQTGHKSGITGSIQFESLSGLLLMTLRLHSINGLYYRPLGVLTVNSNPICPRDSSVSHG